MTQNIANDNTESYLSKLNPEQRAAVEALDGPVLVLAGAGTGKTRVLTTRIAHLLHSKRAFPGQILAVTFTNKAAREMGARVEKLLGIGDQGLGIREGQSPIPNPQSPLTWLGTFHSIGAKILRRHAEKLGFSSSFTILDTDDQLRLLKTIIQEKNIDEKSCPPKMILGIISSWKDQGLRPEKVSAHDGNAYAEGRALPIYKTYQERLRTLNAMDFGDLLLHNLTLFAQYPDLLGEYARRFQYILVDEYQDTNVAQYLWLRLLALEHKNICCVGDDDQSIYGWRGAEVGNILRFEQDFPGAKIIRLERNYRSTGNILAAASGLIANNAGRLGKTLWTEGEDGEPLRIKSVWDDMEEARFVGEEVENWQRDRVKLSEMAILVRAGFQTRAFEERFLTLGVPYRVIGGLRFYERAEIRDAVAYLRVIAQPDDDLAFERIINVPKRGIGKATLEQLHSTARAIDSSLYRATAQLLSRGELKGKLGNTLGALIAHFERWRALAKEHPIAELTEQMLEESGYRDMWKADKSPEAAGRLENLRELVSAMGEFESLVAFLEHVGLVTDTDTTDSSDMVNMMTLHSAKGLEFDVVFLPGWEEGLFPHQRHMDEKGIKGLEEERRLAYVGITRARKMLYISHAANRRIYNQWQSSIPSRFLGELPNKVVNKLEGGPGSGRTGWAQRVEAVLAQSTRPSSSMSADAYGKGTRIFHIKFGYGTVLTSDGTHLDIDFDKAGQKKIMADYVERVE